jgi:hypothetical protein
LTDKENALRTEVRCLLAAFGLMVITLVGALAAPSRPALAAGNEAPMASGRVHYRMTSPMMNGTTVLSWIDHGHKFRQDALISIGSAGKKSQIQSWSLGDGTYLYSYQLTMGKQVLRLKPRRGPGAAGPAGTTPFLAGAGKVVGKATFLGKPCEIRVIGAGNPGGGMKMWVWKGLPLRTEVTVRQGGKLTTEATQIETAPKLSPALFRVPAGYQVRDFKMPARRPGPPALPPR